jgi:16S rRNA (uracil1498-N3)-methyltransferase
MKIHRFIGPFDLSKKELRISGEIAHQITKVLKLKPGEMIELCDELGSYTTAEIVEISGKNVKVKIKEIIKNKENGNKVNLFCAILKKENFELVVQKTTECGISKIIPIITSRTVKTGLNLERLQKIAKEASEQSGRTNVPEISEPMKFEEALKFTKENDLNIFFDISGEKLWSRELSSEIPWEARRRRTEKISSKKFSCILEGNSLRNIWIGPEGGWTPEEIEKAKSLNFKIASLGPLTLRGETAAIVAVYLISNLK